MRRMVLAKTAAGDLAVAYLPDNEAIEIDVSAFPAPLGGRWFDPVHGRYTGIAAAYREPGPRGVSRRRRRATGSCSCSRRTGEREGYSWGEICRPAGTTHGLPKQRLDQRQGLFHQFAPAFGTDLGAAGTAP